MCSSQHLPKQIWKLNLFSQCCALSRSCDGEDLLLYKDRLTLFLLHSLEPMSFILTLSGGWQHLGLFVHLPGQILLSYQSPVSQRNHRLNLKLQKSGLIVTNLHIFNWQWWSCWVVIRTLCTWCQVIFFHSMHWMDLNKAAVYCVINSLIFFTNWLTALLNEWSDVSLPLLTLTVWITLWIVSNALPVDLTKTLPIDEILRIAFLVH